MVRITYEPAVLDSIRRLPLTIKIRVLGLVERLARWSAARRRCGVTWPGITGCEPGIIACSSAWRRTRLLLRKLGTGAVSMRTEA